MPASASIAPDQTETTLLPGGAVTGVPKVLLMLEGVALMGVCTAAFASLGGSWWVFAALLFVPDVSMLGYLVNPRVGATAYNAGHSTLGPVALGTVGLLVSAPLAVQVACIWAAHIGMDRMLGFGLKYGTAFKHTHLMRA